MPSHLEEIFKDNKLTDKIKKRLPHLFHLAELESSRAGKIGMEVGSLRERIIVAYRSLLKQSQVRVLVELN
jgi:hypothetical protein